MFAWRAVFGAILVGAVAGIGFGVGERSAGAANNCVTQPCVWMTDYWNGGGVVVTDPEGGTITYKDGSFAVHKGGTNAADALKKKFKDSKAFPNAWHHKNDGVFVKNDTPVTQYIWDNFTPNCNKVKGGYLPTMMVTVAGNLVGGPEVTQKNGCQ